MINAKELRKIVNEDNDYSRVEEILKKLEKAMIKEARKKKYIISMSYSSLLDYPGEIALEHYEMAELTDRIDELGLNGAITRTNLYLNWRERS